ncbi:DUF3316 domain-containing protein [Vibrio sp. T187]|uniref:DUF3316 domain-containing protein n=1 Tax=Vibrio TaxID=662 RepID=UPI0010C9AE7D|nr:MULTISPECIES: DUF3316 domain-containing protein [Vibrio]MBW3696908.1 DUF3316 domain-containing protein [Vibrio sp. T187]
MKKLTILAATLLISSTAFAGNQTSYNSTSQTTGTFATKAEAYDAGFNYVDSLANATNAQLNFQLLPVSANPISKITVDNTQVTIEEFAKTRGEIAYRAVVNVDYHFVERTKRND